MLLYVLAHDTKTPAQWTVLGLRVTREAATTHPYCVCCTSRAGLHLRPVVPAADNMPLLLPVLPLLLQAAAAAGVDNAKSVKRKRGAADSDEDLGSDSEDEFYDRCGL